jgi:hypothetical protein
MLANSTRYRSPTRKSLRLKGAVVVGIALAALTYGMLIRGAHPPSSTVAAATADATRAQAAARNERRAAHHWAHPFDAEDYLEREGEPRACAPERGITEACAY